MSTTTAPETIALETFTAEELAEAIGAHLSTERHNVEVTLTHIKQAQQANRFVGTPAEALMLAHLAAKARLSTCESICTYLAELRG